MVIDTFLIVIRLSLSAIFAVAAVTKLLDLAGSRKAMLDFDVPARFARSAAIFLPIAEALAAALLLFASPVSLVGGVLASVLLVLFIAGIARSSLERAGTAVPLLRTAALTARWPRDAPAQRAAAGACCRGRRRKRWSEFGGLRHDSSTAVSVALAVTTLATVILSFTSSLLCGSGSIGSTTMRHRAKGSCHSQSASRSQRSPFPRPREIALQTTKRAGSAEYSVFTSATCGPCHALLPELARWRKRR